MGALFAAFGVVLMAPLVMVITMCMANIIFVDGLVAAIAAGALSRAFLGAHPALCILIGALAMGAVIFLSFEERGFKALSFFSSVSWAYIASFIVKDVTGGDIIWAGFAFLATGFGILTLHLGVRELPRL